MSSLEEDDTQAFLPVELWASVFQWTGWDGRILMVCKQWRLVFWAHHPVDAMLKDKIVKLGNMQPSQLGIIGSAMVPRSWHEPPPTVVLDAYAIFRIDHRVEKFQMLRMLRRCVADLVHYRLWDHLFPIFRRYPILRKRRADAKTIDVGMLGRAIKTGDAVNACWLLDNRTEDEDYLLLHLDRRGNEDSLLCMAGATSWPEELRSRMLAHILEAKSLLNGRPSFAVKPAIYRLAMVSGAPELLWHALDVKAPENRDSLHDALLLGRKKDFVRLVGQAEAPRICRAALTIAMNADSKSSLGFSTANWPPPHRHWLGEVLDSLCDQEIKRRSVVDTLVNRGGSGCDECLCLLAQRLEREDRQRLLAVVLKWNKPTRLKTLLAYPCQPGWLDWHNPQSPIGHECLTVLLDDCRVTIGKPATDDYGKMVQQGKIDWAAAFGRHPKGKAALAKANVHSKRTKRRRSLG